ncbi:DUF4198 domain-containing protein [Methanolapillus ohkumae]|uniref:PGF-CTERM archaeal protein-sorting signal domain-containing protein n=1 Tax=Methanolapillus ohkumae TaxID=3028298 RepID=A0AA96ZY38_9EURY|nr:hypothetical protein MsAm2_15490 [Methanosarcinaceae archaeon Am2]
MLKKMTILALVALFVLICAAMPASAHSLMMMSGDSIADASECDISDYLFPAGTTKSIIIAGGHGYEYQYVDTKNPLTLTVVAPDGTVKNITTATKIENVTDIFANVTSPVSYQQATVTFDQDGIYYLYTFQSTTNTTSGMVTTEVSKMMLFVGNGTWDNYSKNLGLPLEFDPYTRLSAVEAGGTIHGQITSNGSPVTNISFYAEQVNNLTTAQQKLNEITTKYPSIGDGGDIYLIYSKRSFADNNGNFVSTVYEPGVWMYVATGEAVGNQTYKTTFTVPVLEPLSGMNSAEKTTDTSLPGFELIAGILAVVGVILLVRRK